MAKQALYKRLWKRVITAIIVILLLIAGALIWILNIEHFIQGANPARGCLRNLGSEHGTARLPIPT
jgi:hypothetical protein